MVNKQRVRSIIMTQSWFAFMLLMVKYMIKGFSNLTPREVGYDLLFLIPATLFIIALTILLLSGASGVYYQLKNFVEPEEEKAEKKETRAKRTRGR